MILHDIPDYRVAVGNPAKVVGVVDDDYTVVKRSTRGLSLIRIRGRDCQPKSHQKKRRECYIRPLHFPITGFRGCCAEAGSW